MAVFVRRKKKLNNNNLGEILVDQDDEDNVVAPILRGKKKKASTFQALLGKFTLNKEQEKKERQRTRAKRRGEEYIEGEGPLKNSNWFSTVNFHFPRNRLTKEQRKLLREESYRITRQVFDENLPKIVKFKDPFGTPKRIKKFRIDTKFEFQKNHPSRQAHIHILANFKHTTQIHLDYGKIHELFSKYVKRNPLLRKIAADTTPSPSHGTGGEPPEPQVHIQRGSNTGDEERLYMEKGTYTIWKKQEVAEYYQNLKDNNVSSEDDRWARFERTEQTFAKPPEGFTPGQERSYV